MSIRRLCEHGKQHYYCVTCGGKGICEHGKRRSICKECKSNKRKHIDSEESNASEDPNAKKIKV